MLYNHYVLFNNGILSTGLFRSACQLTVRIVSVSKLLFNRFSATSKTADNFISKKYKQMTDEPNSDALVHNWTAPHLNTAGVLELCVSVACCCCDDES